MKRFFQRLKDKEERDKQYHREKKELDKAHGRYKSPIRVISVAITTMILSMLLFVMAVPLIAGIYYWHTSEFMGINNKGESQFDIILEANDARLNTCFDIDGENNKDMQVNCFKENMNKGEILTIDLIMAVMVANHAIEINDRELAKSAFDSFIWMEDYRDYEDIKFEEEFIRGADMITRSIGFIAVEWIMGQEIKPEDLSSTGVKTEMLNDQKERLIDEFNFIDVKNQK